MYYTHLCSLLVVAVAVSAQDVDLTLEPMASGVDVVDAVVDKIQRSGIFPDDREFLRRIAYVESRFGADRDTYRIGYHGGIWQVDKVGFESTQINRPEGISSKMRQLHEAVRDRLGIKWSEVKWEDLRKPLYSGIAARLFLADKTGPIPDLLQAQAEYWKRYYNTAAGKGTEKRFVEAVKELESQEAKQTGGEIDLTVVIDGSGSIGLSSYLRALNATANLVSTFNQREANVGIVVFSSGVHRTIPFNSTRSMIEVAEQIRQIDYPDEGTNTNAGMMAAVDMHSGLFHRHEAGIPRVMIVFTDGEHTEGEPPSVAAAAAANQGIEVIAFGIGTSIKDTELLQIANGNANMVFKADSYATLPDHIARIARRTKQEPKKPKIGIPQEEKFGTVGDKRHYVIGVPPEGTTVDLKTAKGQVRGYWSYKVKQPSSAIHDGRLFPGKNFIRPPSTGLGRRRAISANETTSEASPRLPPVYVTLESQAVNATVIMDTLVGDLTGSGSTLTSSMLTLWPLCLVVLLNR